MANRRELSHFILDFDLNTSMKVKQNVNLIVAYGVPNIGKHFIPLLKLLPNAFVKNSLKKEIQTAPILNIVFGGQFKHSKRAEKPHF